MGCRLYLQGRISRRVTVPLPDEAGRAAILGVHLRAVELDESAGDKTQLARQLAALTTGFSGGWASAARLAATKQHGYLALHCCTIWGLHKLVQRS